MNGERHSSGSATAVIPQRVHDRRGLRGGASTGSGCWQRRTWRSRCSAIGRSGCSTRCSPDGSGTASTCPRRITRPTRASSPGRSAGRLRVWGGRIEQTAVMVFEPSGRTVHVARTPRRSAGLWVRSCSPLVRGRGRSRATSVPGFRSTPSAGTASSCPRPGPGCGPRRSPGTTTRRSRPSRSASGLLARSSSPACAPPPGSARAPGGPGDTTDLPGGADDGSRGEATALDAGLVAGDRRRSGVRSAYLAFADGHKGLAQAAITGRRRAGGR